MANNDPSTVHGPQETIEDPEGLNRWKSLAQKHWSKSRKVKKVDPEVIRKEIWDVLQACRFEFRTLLALDNLQLLEKYILLDVFGWPALICCRYLWPGFNDDSTNYHILLIALITTVKRRENLPVWSKSLL